MAQNFFGDIKFPGRQRQPRQRHHRVAPPIRFPRKTRHHRRAGRFPTCEKRIRRNQQCLPHRIGLAFINFPPVPLTGEQHFRIHVRFRLGGDDDVNGFAFAEFERQLKRREQIFLARFAAFLLHRIMKVPVPIRFYCHAGRRGVKKQPRQFPVRLH